jgi:DNA-binding HxlR family transcriptional regulator
MVGRSRVGAGFGEFMSAPRRMESDGLIHREQEENGLRRVTYSLTAKGQEIHATLLGLDAVAERW